MEAFQDRLTEAVRAKRSLLCVGIDVRAASGGSAGLALGRFGLELLDLVASHAACVKPNIAFFEAYGLEGMAAYAAILKGARARGILTIADVKRGDMGATAEAYAQAYVTPGGDLEADAVTLNGYLGADSIEPWTAAASRSGKGLYVLVRTSNPGAKDLQDSPLRGEGAEGGLVYERMAALVRGWGEPHRGKAGLSLVGAVVGATWPEQTKRLRALLPTTPFLVPGYGAQGATAKDVAAAFLSGGIGAVVNASRSVTFPKVAPGADWREAVVAAAKGAQEELAAAVMPTAGAELGS
jgi:orotidine-5'-phosphate decarboxylase